MLERNIRNFLLLLSTLYLTTAKLDFKLHYCRFKCSDQCESDVDTTDEPKPDAYYWRDFRGVIPTDAYPLGPSNQNPQSYIGLVYDMSNNGSFATTIFEGLNYVYSVNQGEVSKATQHNIQILCTREPEKLIWVHLTAENIKTFKTIQTVKAGITNSNNRSVISYIVKASKCMVTYAGCVSDFNIPMQYALLDGTLETTESFLWLLYSEEAQKKKNNNPRPFFSHHYEYTIQPNSIIPKFFKQINVGPCSIICTNEDMGKQKKLQSDNKFLSSMAYYWRPNSLFDANEAISTGPSLQKPLYVGRANFKIFYDVGGTNGDSTTINVVPSNIGIHTYFQIMSTKTPEKFEWVNSSSDSFAMLDKSRLILGLRLRNGTGVFIGREPFRKGYSYYSPGSVRQFENGTYIYSAIGSSDKFQVLMLKDTKKNS